MDYGLNSNGRADSIEVVDFAKNLALVGGDWPQFKDYPHLQMDFGLALLIYKVREASS